MAPEKPLTPQEEYVIVHKGTEPPFTGKYENSFEEGVYVCRRCQTPLYRSQSKFHSGCGWPSFDDEIAGAVKHVTDADEHRVEILCAACGGHLGHVFQGEGFTVKDTRHCVNSVSLQFVPAEQKRPDLETAILGGGCFWCVEAALEMLPGVVSIRSGYAGGTASNPTYEAVCSGKTGHAEVVRILYDPSQISYEKILELFFLTHDPTTPNRQGNDIGTQYRSIILYTTEEQKKLALSFIDTLSKGSDIKIVTEVAPLEIFYEAEAYHQSYYRRNLDQPYCQAIIDPKIKKLKSFLQKKTTPP